MFRSWLLQCAALLCLSFVAQTSTLLAADTAPVIASLTSSRTVEEGSSVNLEVKVNGTAPFTYQWKLEGVAIPGATKSIYSIPLVRVADTGSYTVEITNSVSTIVSPVVLLNVNPGLAPSIYYSPSDTSFVVGQSLNMSFWASGSSPIVYEWKKDGVVVPGATTSNFSVTAADASYAGTYVVKATNFLGSATSSSFKVTASLPVAPTVSIYAYETAIEPGQYFSIYSSVSGTGPFTYQWYRGGVAITGQTNYYLSDYISDKTVGDYLIEVTNSVGTKKSSVVTLSQKPIVAPVLYDLTSTLTLQTTGYLSLYASLRSGNGVMTWQWYKDGVVIPGATTSSLSISNVSLADAGSYSVKATNSAGSATSSNCVVSVTAPQPPVIRNLTGYYSEFPGSSLFVSVDHGGTGPFKYLWKKNGATTSDSGYYFYATVPAAGVVDKYTVTITNAYGNVTSGEISVEGRQVIPPVIVRNPIGGAQTSGMSFQFSIDKYGDNVSYRWFRDDVEIPNANQQSLYINNLASSDEGSYHVVISNSAGQATSAKAKLKVIPASAPVITQHPNHASLLPGQWHSMGISHTGYSYDSSFTYQWYKDGVALPNSNSSSFSINSAQPSDAGSYTCKVTSALGSATSEAGVVTVDSSITRPLILAQSGSVAVNTQGAAYLTINAQQGSTYIWKKDGAIIPGASNSYFYINDVRSVDAGAYTVEVTNGSKSLVSRTINLSLLDTGSTPRILVQPSAVIVQNDSDSLYLSVQAEGEKPFTYQWYKNGAAIEGGTYNYYQVSKAIDQLGDYKVKITNKNGSVESDVAKVTKMAAVSPPTILSSYSRVSIAKGSSATLYASVLSYSSVSFSWSKDGGEFSSGYYYYTLTSPGKYRFKATNESGSVTSPEIEVVEVAELVGPKITTSPSSVTVYAGDTITLKGTATGATSYAWRKDGVTISGATSATLTIPNANSTHAGVYVMLASNTDGTSPSAGAQVKVEPAVAPKITAQPLSRAVNQGEAVSFSVTATGLPAPSYQWYKNDVAITGATSATYAIAGTVGADQGTFKVVATNLGGSVTSSGAYLTVYTQPTSAPAFITQPQDTTIKLGGTAVLKVTVSGYPIPALQWRKNGQAIAGATGSILEIPSAVESDAATYSVVASNDFGSSTSSDAKLVVSNDAFIASYSGSWPNGDAWALLVRANNTAVFIALLASKNQLIVKDDVVINSDGSFEIPALAGQTLGGEALASLTYTGGVKGKIENGRVSGSLPGAGLTFSADVVAKGVTQDVSGYYAATSVNSVLTTTYTVITQGGTAIVGVSAGGKVLGGTATVSADGKVTLTGSTAAALQVTKSNADVKLEGSVTLSTGSVSMAPMPKQDQAASQRLLNLSTRGWVGDGQKELTAGLYIQGTEPKTLLIRAVGPTLGAYDVPNTVAEPKLTLYKGQTVFKTNQGWGTSADASLIPSVSQTAGAFALQAGSKDSVILTTLEPGLYTAAISESSKKGGVALIEVYEVNNAGDSNAARPRLYNLSTRGYVGSGGSIMIVGLVVDGDKPKKILIRGIGPTLTDFGITDAVADPVLSVYKGSTMIAENDDWDINNDAAALASSSAKAGAFSLKSKAKDSAIILFVNPGNYTAHLRGKNDGTGIGLIEVYELTD